MRRAGTEMSCASRYCETPSGSRKSACRISPDVWVPFSAEPRVTSDLVRVDDRYVIGVSVPPGEADPPLIVDADAVLPAPIAEERHFSSTRLRAERGGVLRGRSTAYDIQGLVERTGIPHVSAMRRAAGFLALILIAGSARAQGWDMARRSGASRRAPDLVVGLAYRGARSRDRVHLLSHRAAICSRPAVAAHRTSRERAAQPERKLLDDVAKRVRMWRDVEPFYPDQTNGLPKTSESRGTEAVLNALVLATRDAAAGRPSEEAGIAFDNLWALQFRRGKPRVRGRGSISILEPWEADDAAYFGAALAAVAVWN